MDLSLSVVAGKADPPVCKLVDEKQEREERARRERERRRAERERRKAEAKEVRFSTRTEANDLSMKLSKVERMLDEGHSVRLAVRFRRGDRLSRPRETVGKELLEHLESKLSAKAYRQHPPRMPSPAYMHLQLAPSSRPPSNP